MSIFKNVGDTIEGNVVDGNTRRFERKCLKKHPITNKQMFLYSCDRNSRAIVVESVEKTEDEVLAEATSHFHRNENDELQADAISIYVDSKRPIKTEVKEGVSGRHGATLFHITENTIATIKTPLENARKQLGLNGNGYIEDKHAI